MSRARLLLAAFLALAALSAGCGDDEPAPIVEPPPPPPPPPPPAATFTKLVIDMVQNQTKDNTAPVAAMDFLTLDDPDANNQAAYSSLFQ